mmetsp:Transcript_32751/g.55243  ORF Transcript_32751/g.55243 Transcript_32751/m.55243 type:complete len:225 (-) Transcript_32751:544-1218(-)
MVVLVDKVDRLRLCHDVVHLYGLVGGRVGSRGEGRLGGSLEDFGGFRGGRVSDDVEELVKDCEHKGPQLERCLWFVLEPSHLDVCHLHQRQRLSQTAVRHVFVRQVEQVDHDRHQLGVVGEDEVGKVLEPTKEHLDAEGASEADRVGEGGTERSRKLGGVRLEDESTIPIRQSLELLEELHPASKNLDAHILLFFVTHNLPEMVEHGTQTGTDLLSSEFTADEF